MMFGLGSFNLINEFERAFNESNTEQLGSSSARLQPYLELGISIGTKCTSKRMYVIPL